MKREIAVHSKDIITFWFEDIEPAKWWSKDVQFDGKIIDLFAEVHRAANCCELSHRQKNQQEVWLR